jgi:hypothetical protein
MTINKRKTMNWQELVGKVGGLMGFIGMFASRVVGYFSELQFASLVANRLYTWKEPKNVTQSFKKKGIDGEEIHDENKGKVEEPVMFLDKMGFRRLWYRAMCGMCCRDRYWNTYKKTLDDVNSDMKKEMDIVTLMRRVRALNLGMSILFEEKTLHMISAKGARKPSKPLDESEDVDEIANLWCTYSRFNEKEKNTIA